MSARPINRRLRLFVLVIMGALALEAAASCSSGDGAGDGIAPTIDGSPVAPVASNAPIEEGGVSSVTKPIGEDEVEELDAAGCRPEDCAPGYLCCTPCCVAGRPPVCMPAVDGKCPLPDLTIDEGALATGIALDRVEAGACELEEQCVAGPGTRRVLRFDVRVPNRGVADLRFGRPAGNESFEWAACHQHFHFKDFANYALLDEEGRVVVAGRKQAFCARDSARVDRTAEFLPKYDCENQGIQRGWADIYPPEIPCQYIDVTDVPPGTYWLEVVVNPERIITELDYDNNRAAVRIELP